MVSTVYGLDQCTNYSIEIGAGPYIYRQREQKYSMATFNDKEAEDSLLATINNIWSSQKYSFKSFGSTIPVSF